MTTCVEPTSRLDVDQAAADGGGVPLFAVTSRLRPVRGRAAPGDIDADQRVGADRDAGIRELVDARTQLAAVDAAEAVAGYRRTRRWASGSPGSRDAEPEVAALTATANLEAAESAERGAGEGSGDRGATADLEETHETVQQMKAEASARSPRWTRRWRAPGPGRGRRGGQWPARPPAGSPADGQERTARIAAGSEGRRVMIHTRTLRAAASDRCSDQRGRRGARGGPPRGPLSPSPPGDRGSLGDRAPRDRDADRGSRAGALRPGGLRCRLAEPVDRMARIAAGT